MTYWEEDIAPIHNDHDQTPNTREVEEVARAHEGDSDDVVGEHLVVVLSRCFGVEYQDLVRVEGGLSEIVEFEGTCEGQVGVSQPDIRGV